MKNIFVRLKRGGYVSYLLTALTAFLYAAQFRYYINSDIYKAFDLGNLGAFGADLSVSVLVAVLAAVGWAGGAATAFFTRKKGLRSGTAYWIAGMFALVALLFTPYNLQLLMPTTNQQNISMICCIANIVFMLVDMWVFSFALLRGGARLAESEGLAGAVYACCAAAVATAPAFAAVAAEWPFAVCVGIYAALLTVLSTVKLFFPEEECACDVAGGRTYAVSGIVTALFVAVLAGAYFITEAHIAL